MKAVPAFDNVIAGLKVSLPQGNQMSIIRVAPTGFTQEQVYAVWNGLIGDTEMFFTSQEMTRAEIEAAIIFAQERIEKAGNDEDMGIYREQLEYFKSIYVSAPESKSRERVYGTLQELYETQYGSEEKTPYQGVMAESADGNVRFNVQNPYGSDGGASVARMSYSRKAFVHGADGAPIVESRAVDIADTAAPAGAGEVTLSPRSAAETVNAFLADADLPFAIAAATLNSGEDDRYYLFFCTRLVGGIPSAFLLGESYYEDEDANYAKRWEHEMMSVTVDEEGIRSFVWEAPIETVETVVENCTLLPFSDIREIFNKMAFVTYGFQAKGINTLHINVSDIKLETLRIVEQNANKSGLLVPVWNFYGTRVMENTDGTSTTTSHIILMSINAVDGSIIDLAKGY
ncbi:MAG: DUF6034 family protein [Clostridia bacterium]|nr:DUF6034 family protein [Clostridia bacterium]